MTVEVTIEDGDEMKRRIYEALLSKLKGACKSVTGYDETRFFDKNHQIEGRPKISKWQSYYLKDFRDNLFYGKNDDYFKNVITHFYTSGHQNFAVQQAAKFGYHGFLLGNETTKNYPLVSMGAMRSSSALIANILSRKPFDNGPMKITLTATNDHFIQGDYEVYFEFPLRTLIKNGKPTHPSMADAVLMKKDENGDVVALIIIESKLMEYFAGKPSLATALYLDEANYYPELRKQYGGFAIATAFADLFSKTNQKIESGKIKFDAGQLLHHALGYLNERLDKNGLFATDEFSKLQKVSLVNAVWCPTPKTQSGSEGEIDREIREIWENEESKEQREAITADLCDLMSKAEPNGADFSFVFLPALEFADLFKQGAEFSHYLERYRL